VYTVRRPGRRAVLGLAARALTGRLDGARDFESHAAREVLLDASRPRLRVGVDGELLSLPTPLRLSTRPGALRLVGEA
jgi:diacylglycerol kinase family enzyme